MEAEIFPPRAQKHPHVHSLHGDERRDNYFWLRDRHNPAVIAYLEAENAYTSAMMRHTEPLQAVLYNEMLSRIQETDQSVPYRQGGFYYYTRTEAAKAYPIYCRKQGNLDAAEEVLLDQNQMAEGHSYFRVGMFQVSPNHQILAYSVDTTGSEIYTLFFKDLTTQQIYPERIFDIYYSFAWGNDSQTLFYTQVEPTYRPANVLRHTLGWSVTEDVLVYHEPDDAYEIRVYRTRSEAYILIELRSKVTSEVHFLDANHPTQPFEVFQRRSPGIEYSIEHHSDYFYITTNEDAINFKLMRTPIIDCLKENWQTVIPHREEVMISNISVFTDHLVIYEQEAGLPQVRVRKLSTGVEHYITFREPTYEVYEEANAEFNSHTLRYSYTSLVSPNSIFEYNLETQEQELKKETPVSGYDRTQYVSERIQAIAPDNTPVPLSLVYKKGTEKNGANPLLMIGYGYSGYGYRDAFSANWLSLLDRGVVVAIAHVRGGSEMGRKWYENGKLLNKKNTFTDFIACAERLIEQRWTSPEHLAISGISAGGLLMGSAINLRPDLFKAVVARVPFVDLLTSVLDTSVSLSVMEWEELGNPNDKVYYDYIKSYSPYDNVEAKDYPAMLITAGLNDPAVFYWEPAKWTAKLRDLKTDNNLLLLQTSMEGGHEGASGRYDQIKDIAFEYAFLLEQWGLCE